MMRKIVVDGKEYKWRCGRMYVVVKGESKSWHMPAWDLVGVSPDTFDRGVRKGTQDGMVTPRMVAQWIKNNMN